MKRISGLIVLLMYLGGCGVSSLPGSGGGSADAYEEDDLYTQAKTMSVGSSQDHNFADDTSDWILFDAVAGYTYTIETSNLGVDADTDLTLYSGAMSYLMSNDDIDSYSGNYASRIDWTATSS
ncbi:MAG: hypothetical protein OEX12_13095, partial [Gammaproteobacteria bacterium]|nr:hypothetical protein [Gammaproteobacteria bacterium]